MFEERLVKSEFKFKLEKHKIRIGDMKRTRATFTKSLRDNEEEELLSLTFNSKKKPPSSVKEEKTLPVTINIGKAKPEENDKSQKESKKGEKEDLGK